MKRLLLFCLGMLLLGAAGLLVLHQVVQFPSPAVAQPGASLPGPRGAAAPGEPPVEPGQFKEIVPALLEALADTDGSVRQLAGATLAKIGPDAVRPLIEALKAKDRDTRANAAYVLGHQVPPSREALPALAKALKDDDKEVRRRVAYAINRIVLHSEAASMMPSPESVPGPAGLEGPAGSPPMPGMAMPGSAMPRMPVPPDPGLLLPESSAPAKPGKDEKKP
jgi:hypothetical protein